MPRADCIELGRGRDMVRMPILYEDRSVMAIDKPAGWLLVPFSWQRTPRNLQAAITSSIAARDFWARSRNLKFLRHVHRLDGETTGVLLLAKSQGAVNTYADLFESRRMDKTYLAVVHGAPAEVEWICRARLAPDSRQVGRVLVDPRRGKEAETAFRVLHTAGDWSLIEARPVTGRTHQIRVHLLEAGCPVAGDTLYGPKPSSRNRARTDARTFPLGLRAVSLCYTDPFTRASVCISAPREPFLKAFGMDRAGEPCGYRPSRSGAA